MCLNIYIVKIVYTYIYIHIYGYIYIYIFSIMSMKLDNSSMKLDNAYGKINFNKMHRYHRHRHPRLVSVGAT